MFDIFSMDPLFGTIWAVVFFGILGVGTYIIVSALKRKIDNDRKPVEKVFVTLIAKNAQEHYRHNATSYSERYLTFETMSGERIAVEVDGEQYALFMEGDQGTLTHQGYRFIDFVRE